MRDVEVGAGVFDFIREQGDVALDQAGLGFDGHAAQAEAERERSRRSWSSRR